MTELAYNEDEYDLLKELFNVAMGQAGRGLAVLLNSFVELSIPDIKIVPAEKIIEAITENSTYSKDEVVTAIRQTFYNDNLIEGETIVFFGENSYSVIADILGYSSTLDTNQQNELLLEISNIVSGASINGFSKQLFKREMTFSPPTVLNEKMEMNKLLYSVFMRRQLQWDYTLFVKINFKLKTEGFKSDLLVFMSEKSIDTIKTFLDKQLALM
ncbi:hypothetical protein [Candidatus Magnetomonas plexicatena]|uniref:hypothetical protein n=1 Tax=Candidatus Magnetomonas plexicatena TaxID=2552947 RepID=UPI00110420F5|nr:hypothetical protein E2O03_014335 [Nitrospirales bacterium LBB_01]